LRPYLCSMNTVRVRFAPSPTGGLHLGGVRTVLYNYLFAKKNGGQFIVRVEDTDQTRFVEGAEQYIMDCLNWCGITPDESPQHGGQYAPYRQSERKASYRQYAEKLVAAGHAYYAFDTPQEIETMREELKAKGSGSLQYDHHIRMSMRNSLRLLPEETQQLLDAGTPHVIRIKIPANEFVTFADMIRGEIEFDTNNVDDKVLLKADGMPTYHLAVVVDDYLMKISHAFRGEEWLPSAPVHILLWKYLFGLDVMPQWAHLPLILKPDGNGKLSKRDGDRLGFPVYAMDWKDPNTGDITKGFKELGFLPEAFINLLAVLGWNDGTEQEVFTLEELIEKFSIERVHKGGAKFDFEKAKWYNAEWIKRTPGAELGDKVSTVFAEKGMTVVNDEYLTKVIDAVKERCTLLTDFYTQAGFFFAAPQQWDTEAVKPKWTAEKAFFFEELTGKYAVLENWDIAAIETEFKNLAAEKNIKPGELQLPMRVMLVGGKFGPAVFEIAALIGRDEAISRIKTAVQVFNN
jgi:glutamyl-tRNA synthetase